MSSILNARFVSKGIYKAMLAFNRKRALAKMKQHPFLWGELEKYIEKSGSTGCEFSDYWMLYEYIRKNKPTKILECGTGVSTIAMACALIENEKENGVAGKVISMESIPQWHQQAVSLLPSNLSPYVELVLSEKVEYCHSIFRGVGYKDIPDHDYEFVFIDGPGTSAPSDNTRSFNFDFINVVKKSNRPVYGVTDKRLGTTYVMQKIFGMDKVRYESKLGLGLIGPCTKEDIRSEIKGSSFSHKINAFGKNELNLRMLLSKTSA